MSESIRCDLCGTNPATHHVTEVDFSSETIHRHLCASCFSKSAISADEVNILNTFRDRVCQYCGKPAQSLLTGLGAYFKARTRLMCSGCTERYNRFVLAELNTLSDDLSRDEQFSALRELDERVELYMTSNPDESGWS